MADSARVFISYSSKDRAIVKRLMEDLKQAGVAVWFDHEQLKPGTRNWTAAVRRGVEQATDVVYAASPDAADSTYVGHELAIARDEGMEDHILPFWVRGEKWSRCVPFGYYYTQYIDGRAAAYPAGLQALLAALGIAIVIPFERFPERLVTLGFTPQARDSEEWITPPVSLVPSGPFRLGSDRAHDSRAQNDELKRRIVDLPAFEIARFPVTVAEYACFLRAPERMQPRSLLKQATWQQQLQQLDHPVVDMSWYDAFDYAAWLAERTGQPWRLPTEAEWEKAARCDPRDPLGASSERIYPWGDHFDFETKRCNTGARGRNGTTPVGWYGPDNPNPRAGRQSGASPCGAEELAGNVWEWLATAYKGDYSKSETAERRESTELRCLRGGSCNSWASEVRAAFRSRDRPDVANDNLVVGFRLARDFHPAGGASG